jgi:TRAP-type mannitol/chloroaromatic compound transport system permease small subunit
VTETPRGDRSKSALEAPRRALGATVALFMILVVPLSLLLFLQWPLREWVQAYSREANDLAQCLFALYVAVAITYASRRRAHLAADALAQRYPERVRRWLARIASPLILAPWSLYVLYAAWPMVLQSVRQLESFPETFNPGYFVIKVALLLMTLLVLLQSVIDALSGAAEDEP